MDTPTLRSGILGLAIASAWPPGDARPEQPPVFVLS